MPTRERHHRCEWSLPASPEALWPLVADTDRFNRDTGVPRVEPVPARAPGRLREPRLRTRRFGVVRRYTRGPLDEMWVAAELQPAGPSFPLYRLTASRA